ESRQIFGTTRWGRPSRFLGNLPPETYQQKATRATASMGARERFVDRAPRSGGIIGPWHHPHEAPSAARPRSAPPPGPGERYGDREFYDDTGSDGHDTQVPLRRGSRVRHERFGEGEVRRIETSGEPSVVAFFPGWGEKKILARFLKLA